MSDSESTVQGAPHPSTGGKSLASLERPRYKSWRKKFRKMRAGFDVILEENKRLFKEEQKLEGIAKRLREELDGLLELCLDINQNPATSPDLRFDVSMPEHHTAVATIKSVVPKDITPQQANDLLLEYRNAVQTGTIPHLDLHVIREQIDEALAKQGVVSLETLEATVPHTVFQGELRDLPQELLGDDPPAYLTSEQEDAYLLRLDAKCEDPISAAKLQELHKDTNALDDKHLADLTPRELERQIEMLNPQSQHNWLKQHAKQGGPIAIDIDDTESQAGHDSKPARGGKRNLAKQVGDRAVERAREEFSPSAASAGFGEDEEMAYTDEQTSGSAKKRGRVVDNDGTYRVKGGKGSASRGKRKRSGEDVAFSPSAGKKARTEDI